MRSDELPARLILSTLVGRRYILGQGAKRLWTYSKGIIGFYEKLANNLQECVGQTLHCAGNADNRIVTNTEHALLVSDIRSKHVDGIPSPYEAVEMTDGKSISFEINAGFLVETSVHT